MALRDDFELANQRAKGLQRSVPRVVAAHYDRKTGRVVIQLSSKLIVSFSPGDVEGLEDVKAAQLSEIEISPSGFGIHGWKMDAETGRADFYFAKLCGLDVFQPFYIAGREAHDQFGTELNHDPPGLAIVMRGNYSWNTSLQALSTLVCQFEIVTQRHEFAPRPGTTFPGDPSRPPPCAQSLAARIHNSPRTLPVLPDSSD